MRGRAGDDPSADGLDAQVPITFERLIPSEDGLRGRLRSRLLQKSGA